MFQTCVISAEGADVRFKTTCNPSVMERGLDGVVVSAVHRMLSQV